MVRGIRYRRIVVVPVPIPYPIPPFSSSTPITRKLTPTPNMTPTINPSLQTGRHKLRTHTQVVV